MNFNIGDILLCKGYGLFGKLVRFGNLIQYRTLGYAHAGIICDIGKNKDGVDSALVYEALGDGFQANWYEIYWLENQIQKGFFIKGNTIIKQTNVKENADKYLGNKYGYFDIFHIGLYWITGKKFQTDTSKNIICSEAIARILYDSSNKKINFSKEFDISYDLISPQDLLNSKQINWKDNN